MINKEELIKYLEEQMRIYWEEPFGGIYTAEEAVELIKLFPETVVPCFTCGYYHKENNTCNIKKCSGYGIGYVTKSDQSTCTFFTKQE